MKTPIAAQAQGASSALVTASFNGTVAEVEINNGPINLVTKFKRNLASLRGIYIDCGSRDQYHIHYGTRILSKRLHEAGIDHTYEEFDDNHSDVDYRMDVSLPFLYGALKP